MSNQEDRLKVLTELTKNLVIEAGAGTGKTTLLIQRVCVAVLAQAISIEKLVALTFTEKAAAEIKTRLLMQLHQIMQEVQTTPTTALAKLFLEHFHLKPEVIISRAEAALARLDLANVGTIHSFCADILKTFPLEAGLTPNTEIDSGQKAKHLFEARWNTFLDNELGLSAPRGALWKRVLPTISLPDLKDFAWELCSGKIVQYDYFSHASMIATLCEEKSHQAQAWSTAFLAGSKKPRNSEKALVWAAQSLVRSAAFLRKESVPPVPEETEPPAFPATPSKGWDEETFEDARALVEFAQKLTPENQQNFLDALEIVGPVVDQVRSDYQREGILSFDDLLVKTRDLLQQNLWVRRLLKEKFDLLFIDEFQDTDPVQGELLLFLAEEKLSSATRWQDVRLTPGKLVVVGDPKQSIYRFRGADITAYELFSDLILRQGGEKCFLQKNFRSAPDIVTLVNEVCHRAMIQEASFQPAYVPIFPAKPPQPQAVEWLFVTAPEQAPLADDYRHNQAEQIARWIENNVGKVTLANGQKLTYADIAILSRASTTSGPYTEALRRHGIAFNVETDKDFYRKQEVNDFLNFLRVAADPTDRTALAGVLRSPLGGFTDEEIYQIAARGELTLQSSPKDKTLAACYQQILQFARQAGRSSLKELLADLLDHTFLPEACAAAYDGERTLASLQRLVRLAVGYAEQMPATLHQFLASVQDILINEPERLGASAVDDAKNAVSVLTVHKSKGLGFPVVILADLSKREAAAASQQTPHIFSWQYNMHGLRAGKIRDANLAFLEEEQKKQERCEEVRVLYVALTRAKDKMILVADGRKGAEKAAGAFAAAGLFPDGKMQQLATTELSLPVKNIPYEAPENFLYRVSSISTPLIDEQELASWQHAWQTRQARYQQVIQQPLLSPSEQVQIGETFSVQQRVGAEIGSACHKAFEQLLLSPMLTPKQAVERACAGKTVSAEVIFPLVRNFVQSDLWRTLQAQKVLACEMPFTLAQDGGTVSGVMDAVLQESNGTIWVIDYKTDIIPAQGTRELLEKYRPQLEIYRQAAKQLFPKQEVRVSAIFVRAFAAEDL